MNGNPFKVPENCSHPEGMKRPPNIFVKSVGGLKALIISLESSVFERLKQKLKEGRSWEKLPMALEKVESQGKQLLVNNSILTGIILSAGAPCIGFGMRSSERWPRSVKERAGVSLAVPAGRELGLLIKEAKK